MSFGTAAKQHLCFDVESGSTSRSSGKTSDVGEAGGSTRMDVSSGWKPAPGNHHSRDECSELDERIEDLMLEEGAAEKESDASLAESLRQLSENGFAKAAERKSLADVTNTNYDESPRSRFPKKSHSYDYSCNRRYSKYCSELEIRASRKRSLDPAAATFKKRRSTGDGLSARYGEDKPSSHLISRAQSCSVVGSENSRSERIKLPGFLHVEYSLETVSEPQIDSVAFKSISGDVLARLMTSMSEEDFSRKYILVDCRYPYEYEGGHLRGAINIFDVLRIPEVFFPESFEEFSEISAKIPIFYCEYSQKRGPTMAQALRQVDRRKNEERYPEVDYKEIYLLDRGYKKFFENEKLMHLCEPQSYTRMIASSHKDDLRRYQMHKSKSMSAFSYSTLQSQRDLRDAKFRFPSVSEADLRRNARSDFFRSSYSRGSCRGNIFGSPFDGEECPSPEPKTLRPIDFGSLS